MAFNPKAFTLPPALEEGIKLEIHGNKLFAWSKNRQKWIELDEKWQVVPESALESADYYRWEQTKVPEEYKLQGYDYDPTASRFTDEKWEELPTRVKDTLLAAGFKRQHHRTTVLPMYAYTKRGHQFRNFRYVNHELYADVYR